MRMWYVPPPSPDEAENNKQEETEKNISGGVSSTNMTQILI